MLTETLEKYLKALPDPNIIVALSGGADSVALLISCCDARDQLRLRGLDIAVHSYHLNHCLRGDMANRDHRFCGELSAANSVVFHSDEIDVQRLAGEWGISFESAGRRARYAGLEKLSKKLGVATVFTAHHSGDSAETFFINLFRGAGTDGLAGVPRTRKIGDTIIIRPLLDFTKQQILDFLISRDQKWMEDHTNEDSVYLRNRIRNKLIPLIEEEFGLDALKKITDAADNLATDKEYLNEMADEILREALKAGLKDGMLDVESIKFRGFHSIHRVLVPRLLKKSSEILMGSGQNIGRAQILAITGNKNPRARFEIGTGAARLDVIFRGDDLYIQKKSVAGKLRKTAPHPHGYGDLNVFKTWKADGKVDCRKYSGSRAAVDLEKIRGEIKVRTWQEGDSFVPLGMNGTKKLQDFFTDLKICEEERRSIAIVCDAEKIIWVAGLRISQLVKVNPDTEKILVLEFE